LTGGGRRRYEAALNKNSKAMETRVAKFSIGQVVRHRVYPFRGVIYNVDPIFANTEEWWRSIPEDVRPSKDQPFYHLYAENAETQYVAYVSEQNLLADESGEPVRHPQVDQVFVRGENGRYRMRGKLLAN
jgi:heat shock protein HspQ